MNTYYKYMIFQNRNIIFTLNKIKEIRNPITNNININIIFLIFLANLTFLFFHFYLFILIIEDEFKNEININIFS